MSYLFYAAWNPPFVVLLWLSTVGDWFFAKNLHRTESQRKRKALLFGSLALNLGLLSYFKYGTFFLENFTNMLQTVGIAWAPAPMSIILPVGISFYTFQTLSYTIDVYRGSLKPSHSFLDFALFVTFFPQLVAGPIVRASDFLPQCETPLKASSQQMGWGLILFVIGLFSKVVIADDVVSKIANTVYDPTFVPDTIAAWVGTLAFAIQIFSDFFGYSTCAIGVALCLGFVLPDNFRFPYAAIGFQDFWTRWHISLSSWLRDYLYIPLGGNRGGDLKTYRNLAITMLLGGLWHGASWMFVIWGAMHGLYLTIERLLRAHVPEQKFFGTSVGKFGLALLTFVAVCFTWVFFRAGSLESALNIAWAMIGGNLDGAESLPLKRIAPIIVLTPATLALHWWMKDISLEQAFEKFPVWSRAVLIAGACTMIILAMTGEDSAFIYFQF